MLTMQRFQQEGIQTHDQVAKNLRDHRTTLAFDTPLHHVTIAGMESLDDTYQA